MPFRGNATGDAKDSQTAKSADGNGLSTAIAEVYSAPAPAQAQAQAQAKAATPKVAEVQTTYCNPMNLDYAFAPKKDYSIGNSHRSTADASCIRYGDDYLLFSTNQEGYWSSKDLSRWQFIAHKFKLNGNDDQVCAPAAFSTDKGVLLLPSFNNDATMPLYRSVNPLKNEWTEATKSFPFPAWDPAIFQDDDKKIYFYWGSSNLFPIRGVELDPDKDFSPKQAPQDLINLDPTKHGWERFGDNNSLVDVRPFIEGASMNKFGGRYYLQYAAPGTEWNVYGDGVYISDKPLGPFVYQQHNPFSWKPTGYIRGAGHGSTFDDKFGNLWHIGSMVVGIKDKFERRLGLFPSGVDEDGVLFTDTAFGDYPHKLPTKKRNQHTDFAGWTLLSYHKKGWASESKTDPVLAFDEDIKTYWSAPNGKPGQYLAVDLGKEMDVRAIQVNFADEKAEVFGKQDNFHHRYQVFQSADGKEWQLLVDKSKSEQDTPHDYIELTEAARARYLKVVNVEMPSGCFAIGDLRVFGKADGPAPPAVSRFAASRGGEDKRNARLSWTAVPDAYAYEIEFGIDPDKLYSSLLVYDDTHYDLRSLNTDSNYYFRIRAVGEAGISEASPILVSHGAADTEPLIGPLP